VGSNVLLRKADGSEINFYRQGSVDTAVSTRTNVIAFNSGGETYYADRTFSRGEQQARTTIWHELGHNWDEQAEHNLILPGTAAVDYFRLISGWTQTDPRDPFGFRQSGDGQWWYRTGSTFARTDRYGSFNPFED